MIDRRAWVATAAAAIRTASADKSSFHRGVDAGYRLLHRVIPPRLKTCTAADSSYYMYLKVHLSHPRSSIIHDYEHYKCQKLGMLYYYLSFIIPFRQIWKLFKILHGYG